MIYQDREIQTKDGRTVILRNARPEDSEALIEYLKVTATETSFLVSEPEEITLTMEQEERFIRTKMESPDELMLIGTLDGKHVGNCAICSLGAKQRYRHRCSVAIALYQEYCGLGIGRQMLKAALDEAEKYGYEQVELEVVSTNERGIHLYEKYGFENFGTVKHAQRMKDGTYQDEYLMICFLQQ